MNTNLWRTRKFLTDSGGEFTNSQFLEMCEAMNITVKGTAAESPFSNGLVKRHNMIIANAKNSLANIHGFSPF